MNEYAKLMTANAVCEKYNINRQRLNYLTNGRRVIHDNRTYYYKPVFLPDIDYKWIKGRLYYMQDSMSRFFE